jgi:hypothetical protein
MFAIPMRARLVVAPNLTISESFLVQANEAIE